MRQPSKLRYVECELPSEVEKTIAAFEDSFANSLKPFYDRLADWVANDLPVIEAELESQIALREELLKGSPVNSLGSLDAMDKSTNLTSPKRDPNDPESIRIDERKLGAAGICLLNGRMYKIIAGDRISALRHLWECTGGDYDYFIRLGTSVYTSPLDTYTLFEYNPSTPDKLPFVNKGFNYLTAVGLKNSQFRHRMVWTRGISASFALKAKMASLGFTSEQINSVFSGAAPDADYDFAGAITDVNTLIRTVTRLMFLPLADPLRQPLWKNEANYIELAIRRFLEYRTKKYTSSAIFSPDFWKLFITELRPKDIKELLENRPEILNLELPQDLTTITAQVEKAIAVPAETTTINTYMNNLPTDKTTEMQLTQSLFDLGLSIWKNMQTVFASKTTTLTNTASQMDTMFPLKHDISSVPYLSFKVKGATPEQDVTPETIPFVATAKEILLNEAVLTNMALIRGVPGRSLSEIYGANTVLELSYSAISTSDKRVTSKDADRLEELLLELSGRKTLGDYFGPAVTINPADISALFPTTNLPPMGSVVSIINSKDKQRAVAANSASNSAMKEEPTPSNIPSGVGQGFPSEETFAMLLSRRIDWSSNFMSCGGTTVAPISTEMDTVASYSKTSSVQSNEEWKQQTLNNENIAYLRERLSLTGENVTISDIRTSVDSFITAEEANKKITRKDTKVSSLLSTINTSKDINVVASNAVALVKLVPSAISSPTSPELYSELSTGADRGAGLYAAKNRNYVADQGGKVKPPGLTSGEVRTGLEQALGTSLPFMSGGDEALIPFKASLAVEVNVCQSKAVEQLSAYGRQYEANRRQFERWIVQFINICKHQIIVFQNSIDGFIVAIQQAMDSVLAKLERLLTLDLNFSGKIGFENSLFRCAWGIDLGLKINLLDILLMYLDRFLGVILKPFSIGLGIIGDFINEIMCVPIRWLESILNGAASATSELLGSIGCTVKDFKLPTAVFELLNLINGTFSLRSLVLRKGSADWLRMMGRLRKGKNEFTRLTQFANACASPDLSSAVSALQATAARLISSIPTASQDGIVALKV